MFLLGIWETAQPNMQKGYWMPKVGLKVYVKDAMMD